LAITDTQAKLLTGAYASVRRAGLLDNPLGQKVFTGLYFLYKRYLEDPFRGLVERRPELFKGGHILDVGANIGYTAAVFAGAIDAGYRVYAFEPEPFNFRLLERTMAARRLNSRVVPVHSAVGREQGTIELLLNERHHADHRIAVGGMNGGEREAHVISVALTSIDAFVRDRIAGEDVAFIKVDVQGYEFPVCVGMNDTLLANEKAVVALEYMPEALRQLGFDGPALLEWFSERGYRTYSLKTNGDLERGISNELGLHGYTDLLFSRRELL
jgi:FkbM family methyltransferase